MKRQLAPLLLLISASLMQAQVSSSAPVGLTTYSFPGGASTSFISFPLYPLPLYNGYVSGNATANTITVVGVGAASGALTQAASPAFALLTSGNLSIGQQGRAMRITANQLTSVSQQPANILTLDTTDNTPVNTPLNGGNFTVSPGDTVQVFPAYTLSGLFGNSASSLRFVRAGTTPTLADTVSIYNVRTRKFNDYFFNSSGGVNAWNLVGGGTANVGNTIVYPESAPRITQKASAPANVAGLTGSVPIVPPSVKTLGGATTYTSFRMPIMMALAQLTDSLSPQGFTPNTSFLTATGLGVYGLNSASPALFYLNGAWLTNTGAPIGVVPIYPSSAQIIVNRQSAGTASFVRLPMLPYSVE